MRAVCLALVFSLAGSAAMASARGGLSTQLRQAARTTPTPAQAAPALRRTTLVNDTAHPFSALEFAAMQRWVDRSYVPTFGGKVTVSKVPKAQAELHGVAQEGGHASYPTNDLHAPTVSLVGAPSRSALFHELGHVWQFSASTDQERQGLMRQLHKTGDFYAEGPGSPAELSADAYAQIAMRGPNYRPWWRTEHRTRAGIAGSSTPTPYGFVAGPRKYAAIRSIFDGQ